MAQVCFTYQTKSAIFPTNKTPVLAKWLGISQHFSLTLKQLSCTVHWIDCTNVSTHRNDFTFTRTDYCPIAPSVLYVTTNLCQLHSETGKSRVERDICKSRYSRSFVPVAIRMLNAKWFILLSTGWTVLIVDTSGIHLHVVTIPYTVDHELYNVYPF